MGCAASAETLPSLEQALDVTCRDHAKFGVDRLIAKFGENKRGEICRLLCQHIELLAQQATPSSTTSTTTEKQADTTTATPEPLLDHEWLSVTASSNAWQDERELERLKNLDLFVLDNSLRETTVAALHSHSIETKKEILAQLKDTGLEREMIVGTFGKKSNVDDLLPAHLAHWKYGDGLAATWGLIDSWECSPEGIAQVLKSDTLNVSYSEGFDAIELEGIANCVLEVNTCNPDIDYDKFNVVKIVVDQVRKAKRRMAKRKPRQHGSDLRGLTPEEQTELVDPETGLMEGRVMVNLRDFPFWDRVPDGVRRALSVVKALAQMPVKERPFGIIFEEFSGFMLPETVAKFTRSIRSTMERFGWVSGKLLIHMHCNFGLAMACTMKALANGADGVWGAVCRYGAQLGHSSTALTLINLARLGNEKVRQRYDIPRIVEAARKIHEIASRAPVDPLEEGYGEQAYDIVFGVTGAMSSDRDMARIAKDICGQPANVRITTFTTPEMMMEALEQRFGTSEEIGWDPALVPEMCNVVKEVLLNGVRWSYNSSLGLATLYDLVLSSKLNLSTVMHQTVTEKVREFMELYESGEIVQTGLPLTVKGEDQKNAEHSSAQEDLAKGPIRYTPLPLAMLRIATTSSPLQHHALVQEIKRRLWVSGILRPLGQSSSSTLLADQAHKENLIFTTQPPPEEDDEKLFVDSASFVKEIALLLKQASTSDRQEDPILASAGSIFLLQFPNGIPWLVFMFFVLWPLEQCGELAFSTVEELLIAAHRALYMRAARSLVPGSGYFDPEVIASTGGGEEGGDLFGSVSPAAAVQSHDQRVFLQADTSTMMLPVENGDEEPMSPHRRRQARRAVQFLGDMDLVKRLQKKQKEANRI